MELQTIRTQVNNVAGSDLSLSEVGVIGNRMLIEIAPFLLLLALFEAEWTYDTESVPAPSDIVDLRQRAWFEYSNGSRQKLDRVQIDGELAGWYYDGINIGIRSQTGEPIRAEGTFKLWYYRHPTLLSGQDPHEEPEGGDIVGAAMIPYIAADYYASLGGDEVSASQAQKFYRDYEVLRRQIAIVRSRLVQTSPSTFRRGD